MNPIEINKAIAKGRLPLENIDLGTLVVIFFFGLYLTFQGIVNTNILEDHHLSGSQWAILAFFTLIAILSIWKMVWLKKLTAYLSILSISKKEAVLKQLNENDNLKITDQYCSISVIGKRFESRYKVIILFDKNGYHVKASSGIGNSEWREGEKTRQIIAEIIRIESELFPLNTAPLPSSL